jgi:RNA polymerase sigma factor (sigma-70 family)
MPNFDRVIDNRWRPDFQSSQRRVREEEEEERLPVIASRELSFVPARPKRFESHDPQTAALIRRLVALQSLPHGEAVSELLEKWQWLDKMEGPEQKQRFVEPLIAAAQRDPEENEHLIVFLMLVFEPVRRSVSKAFIDLHAGLSPSHKDVNWSNRAEARMIEHIEREQLFDVTREAALEAVFRYPMPAPPKFFPWLRETISHRALDKLAGDLPEAPTCGHSAAEAQAIQAALSGLDQVDAPEMSDRPGMRSWRSRIEMRSVFYVVERFFENDAVREVCATAIGRLPRREREVIEGYFFEHLGVPHLADRHGVSESTVYNQKANAQKRLHEDDVFFSALRALGQVRDQARERSLAASYPDGLLPDGRRIVVISAA